MPRSGRIVRSSRARRYALPRHGSKSKRVLLTAHTPCRERAPAGMAKANDPNRMAEPMSLNLRKPSASIKLSQCKDEALVIRPESAGRQRIDHAGPDPLQNYIAL